MTVLNESLREIVLAAREGTEFYEYAASRVEPPYLRTAFGNMAKVKSDLLCALQVALVDQPVRSNGADRTSEYPWGPYASGIYAGARAALRNNPPASCLEELIVQEERILESLYHAVEAARLGESNPRIVEILRLALPRMHLCHDALRRARIRMTISNCR